MPITTARDARRRWLVATATGSVSIHEIVGFLQTARAPVMSAARNLQ